MTTRLTGEQTDFMPFNKGRDHGKGNPSNPDGHRTAYLRREVLTPLSLTNIIELFAKRVEERGEKGKKVIITTIQKLPFIVEGIDDLSDKRFAVILDEAHSSQSGSAADNLNRSLGEGGATDDGEDEVQDRILEAMRRRKIRGNAMGHQRSSIVTKAPSSQALPLPTC